MFGSDSAFGYITLLFSLKFFLDGRTTQKKGGVADGKLTSRISRTLLLSPFSSLSYGF